jgi:protein-tyrosine phosphatase
VTDRPKILVVCGRNKRRSRTAEHIFKNDNRFQIRSAGLSSKSDVQISEKLIKWADIIFVMDNGRRNRIRSQFRSLGLPEIHTLDISDDYEYLDEELINMLDTRINGTLKAIYDF